MSVSVKDFQISQKEYIETKKLAYNYYEIYNGLDEYERIKFLKLIPKTDSPVKDLIIKNTLLFPDTESLINVSKSRIHSFLKKNVNAIYDIPEENLMAKQLEYSFLSTQQLIQQGILKVMSPICYPNGSISSKEYLELKQDAYDFYKDFHDNTLKVKAMIIEECTKFDTYQAKIEISTLLLPNDILLMREMAIHSDDEMSSYYHLPESIFAFKREEYNKQNTETLIKENKLTDIKGNYLWYNDSISDSFINSIWDQSFYQSIEKGYIERVNIALSSMFKGNSETLNSKKTNKY